eukprot:Pgem_evm1s1181
MLTEEELEVFDYEDFIEYLSTKYNIIDKNEIYRRKLMRLVSVNSGIIGGGEFVVDLTF